MFWCLFTSYKIFYLKNSLNLLTNICWSYCFTFPPLCPNSHQEAKKHCKPVIIPLKEEIISKLSILVKNRKSLRANKLATYKYGCRTVELRWASQENGMGLWDLNLHTYCQTQPFLVSSHCMTTVKTAVYWTSQTSMCDHLLWDTTPISDHLSKTPKFSQSKPYSLFLLNSF